MPAVDHEFFASHEFVFDPIVTLENLVFQNGVVRVKNPGDTRPDARLTDPVASKQLFLALVGAHAARPESRSVRFVWADRQTGVYPGLHMAQEVGPTVFMIEDPAALSDDADLTLLMTEVSRFCLPYREDFYEYLSALPSDMVNRTRFVRLEGDILDDPVRIARAAECCRSLRFEAIAWNASSDAQLDRLYSLGVPYAKAPKLFPTRLLKDVFPLKGESHEPPVFDD